MTKDEALQSVLTSATAITSIAGTRCYPAVLPLDPTLPALTYRFISGEAQPTHDTRGIQRSRVQLDCYGETYADAITLRDAVTVTLAGHQDANFTSQVIGTGPDGFDHDLLQYVAICEAYLWSAL